jgi:hypothetical protein
MYRATSNGGGTCWSPRPRAATNLPALARRKWSVRCPESTLGRAPSHQWPGRVMQGQPGDPRPDAQPPLGSLRVGAASDGKPRPETRIRLPAEKSSSGRGADRRTGEPCPEGIPRRTKEALQASPPPGCGLLGKTHRPSARGRDLLSSRLQASFGPQDIRQTFRADCELITTLIRPLSPSPRPPKRGSPGQRREIAEGGDPTRLHITFSSKAGRFSYYFAKDGSGWYQITAAGNQHKATAEQVLNHTLPALARVKPG